MSRFSDKWDVNYNLSFYFLMVVAVLLSAFLMVKGVLAGTIYLVMFAAFTGLIYLGTLLVKNTDNFKLVTQYIKMPVSTHLGVANLFYVVGFLLPILLKTFFNWLGNSSFNIVSLSVPVFGVNIDTGLQSFSAAEIGGSMAWRVFVTMFNAGTMETYIYSIASVIIGVLIGVLFWQQLYGENVRAPKWFVLLVAWVFAAFLFVFSHVLNGNYTGVAFVYATIFILISNISIFLAGVYAMFWIGYHQSNNLLWLFDQNGVAVVLQEGFISWFGVFFVLYFALVIWHLIKNWDSVKRRLREWRLSDV